MKIDVSLASQISAILRGVSAEDVDFIFHPSISGVAQLSKVRVKVESRLNCVMFVARQHARVQFLPHVHRGGHQTWTLVDVESLSRIVAGLNVATFFPRVTLWK